MAGETLYANGVNTAAFLDTMIMDVLRSKIIALFAVRHVRFEKGSDSKKVRKRGTMTATTAAEATDHATSQYQQVLLATLQVAEVKVYAELSDKGKDFSEITLDEMADEGAMAVVDKVEQDICALFDGFSTVVGTTGVDLTPQVLRQAPYNLRINKVPGPYLYMLHPTQVDNVLDYIQAAGAANWANPNVDFSILNGLPPSDNGLVGSYLQLPVFATTNTESINTNADWSGACMNPQRAIAFGEDGRGVRTRTDENIKKGVTALAMSMFYDAKEAEDASGINIVSAQ